MWKQFVNKSLYCSDSSLQLREALEGGSKAVVEKVGRTTTGFFAQIVLNAMLRLTSRYGLSECSSVQYTLEGDYDNHWLLDSIRKQNYSIEHGRSDWERNHVSGTLSEIKGQLESEKRFLLSKEYSLTPDAFIKYLNKLIGKEEIYLISFKKDALLTITKSSLSDTTSTLVPIILMCMWYANNKKGGYLTDDKKYVYEIDLMENLNATLSKLLKQTEKPNFEEFKTVILDYMKSRPEWTIDVEKELKKYFAKDYAKLIQAKKDDVNYFKSQVKTYLDSITTSSASIEKLLMEIEALEDKDPDEESTELIKALNTYKNISTYTFDKNYGMLVTYYTKVECSDEDVWKKAATSYGSSGAKITIAALVDKEFDIYVEDTIAFQKGKNPKSYTWSLGSYDNWTNDNSLFHPHLHYYNCFGNYNTVIGECISKNDIVALVDQVGEVLNTINSYDSAVREQFWKEIDRNPARKCFKDKEGNWFSLSDWLAKQNEKETNNDETTN